MRTTVRRLVAAIALAAAALTLAACDGSITLPTSFPTVSPTVELPTAKPTADLRLSNPAVAEHHQLDVRDSDPAGFEIAQMGTQRFQAART